MGEIEALAVGSEAQRLNFIGAAQALFEQIVFEGQTISLTLQYNRAALRVLSALARAYRRTITSRR